MNQFDYDGVDREPIF